MNKRRKLNYDNCNNKEKIKRRPYKDFYIRDDTKFPSNQLDEVIKRFSDKLGMKTLFDLIPTIDCFSSHKNYQRICKYHITEKDNFFSTKYDNIDFWQIHIAWCFPPYHRKTIVDCINIFKKRKMRGYICVPFERKIDNQYIGETQRICKHYITIKGRDRTNDIFIADRSEITQKCSFDTIIFYFDYHQKETLQQKKNR